MTIPQLSVTRIVNACALIMMGNEAVLTDPYFDEHWFMRMREPIGMKVTELPKLTAIIGGHGVYDHWQPGSLGEYPFKETTPVFVSTQSMKNKAKSAGFRDVEVLDWNETRRISERLAIEAVPAQIVVGRKPNNYVLNSGDLRVFVGTEARDIEPLRRYRAACDAVDVALLPIDGSALAGHKLVMNSLDAIEGARVLGAKVLIPIHYALKSIPILLQTPSSIDDLINLKKQVPALEIVVLKTGERWVRSRSGFEESSRRSWRPQVTSSAFRS
jgi:L-ascorbate metabolism protein UlaG (beta-lactamase superfamily)